MSLYIVVVLSVDKLSLLASINHVFDFLTFLSLSKIKWS